MTKTDSKGKNGAKSGGQATGNGAKRRAKEPSQPVTAGSATLARVADIRLSYPALTAAESAEFMAQHDAEACRKRGGMTKANDIFRIGYNWALTMGANRDDAGLHPVAVRWFLDCLSALGFALDGRATSSAPSTLTGFDDVQRKADTLLAATRRRLASAVGTNPSFREALATASKVDHPVDSRIALLGSLAKLIDGWATASARPPLAANRITSETAKQLRESAAALDHANASRNAPQQAGRDTPAINELEGRTLYAMRAIWDELAGSRREGLSSLQLTVTRDLLRGMDIRVKAKGSKEEDEEAVDEEEIEEEDADTDAPGDEATA